jgi:hypothetical protein
MRSMTSSTFCPLYRAVIPTEPRPAFSAREGQDLKARHGYRVGHESPAFVLSNVPENAKHRLPWQLAVVLSGPARRKLPPHALHRRIGLQSTWLPRYTILANSPPGKSAHMIIRATRFKVKGVVMSGDVTFFAPCGGKGRPGFRLGTYFAGNPKT